MIAFRSCFNSISPPFVASCTARVGSHAQQRFCQAVWMYCRPTLSQPEIPNPKLQYQGGSKRQYLNRRPISGQPCVDRKFQIRSSNNHCLVMSATADPSCSELSEALQRNAKHEARLSNISDLCSFAACENKPRSFARAQDDKRAGVFGRRSFGFKTSRFDYNRRTLINHFE